MNHRAATTRLIAIPIVAVGLLLGSGRAGAYQEGTPVVPVETPAAPEVVETPEPAPIGEMPDSAVATEPPTEPDATAVPGGRAGGEPPTTEDASITAAVDPQPPVDEGEAAKPAPRGRISTRRLRDAQAAPNPAPAPTGGVVPARSGQDVGAGPAAATGSDGGGDSAAIPAPVGANVDSAVPAARSAVVALPSTGVGATAGDPYLVPLSILASALALVVWTRLGGRRGSA